MKFDIDKNKYNIGSLMKRLGYSPHPKNSSFVKRLNLGNFPRFHAYITEMDLKYNVALHLDQKGTCYEGQTAHSGDYDSDVLDKEKERIISLLNV